ncbi:MAG: hypothetical protein Q7R95_11465 [bacterium]|nr:hypothetical protein [bacterium]
MKNKYHLRVYKLSTVTIESNNGSNTNTRMKEIWEASFKDEGSTLEYIIDLTSRGFYCQVVQNYDTKNKLI